MKGFHITREWIATHSGEACPAGATDPCAWLLDHRSPDNLNVFYDLDAAVAAFLWQIDVTETEARRLRDTGQVHIGAYRLKYIPGRFFALDYQRAYDYGMYWSNIGQHLVVHHEPDERAEYAVSKANEAYRYGCEMRIALHALGLDHTKLSSPIKAFEPRMQAIRPPTIDDLPAELHERVYADTIRAGWVEAFSMGHWDTAFDYDITSCYAAEVAQLLDTRRGQWFEWDHYQKNAAYGFAWGTLTTDATFHPFMFNANADEDFEDPSKERRIYTPTGTWDTCLTKDEIDLLNEYHLGTFDIHSGWWWFPEGTQYELFKGAVAAMYAKRQGASPVQDTIIKRILAGMWGKFSEIHGKDTGKLALGEFFNPVYASIVASRARVKVARACLKAGIVPLQVAVDGIVTDKYLPELDQPRTLGGWRLSQRGRCIIAGAGSVAFEGDDARVQDFSLRYDWLAKAIQGDPRGSEYAMHSWKPMHLIEALFMDRLPELGAIVDDTRTVVVGKDDKRFWAKGRPATGGELMANTYDSMPLDVSYVQTADAWGNLVGKESDNVGTEASF